MRLGARSICTRKYRVNCAILCVITFRAILLLGTLINQPDLFYRLSWSQCIFWNLCCLSVYLYLKTSISDPGYLKVCPSVYVKLLEDAHILKIIHPDQLRVPFKISESSVESQISCDYSDVSSSSWKDEDEASFDNSEIVNQSTTTLNSYTRTLGKQNLSTTYEPEKHDHQPSTYTCNETVTTKKKISGRSIGRSYIERRHGYQPIDIETQRQPYVEDEVSAKFHKFKQFQNFWNSMKAKQALQRTSQYLSNQIPYFRTVLIHPKQHLPRAVGHVLTQASDATAPAVVVQSAMHHLIPHLNTEPQYSRAQLPTRSETLSKDLELGDFPQTPQSKPPPVSAEIIMTYGHILARLSDMIPCQSLVPLRFCDVCKMYQPLRTKHCLDCERCVRTMDHHCPWIGNCVGEKNRVWFFTFLSVQFVELVFVILLNLTILVRSHQLVTGGELPLSVSVSVVLSMYYVIITTIIMTCLAFMVMGLLIYQLYLAMSNLTTWEVMSWNTITYLKYLPPESGSPFHHTIAANLYLYFCPPSTRVARWFDHCWSPNPKYLPLYDAEGNILWEYGEQNGVSCCGCF